MRTVEIIEIENKIQELRKLIHEYNEIANVEIDQNVADLHDRDMIIFLELSNQL